MINPSKLVSKSLLRGLFLGCAAFFILWISYARTFERYELQTYDWRFQLRGSRLISPDIVHIDIWNDTLLALGRWPFDREYHAYLIKALRQAGARAVLFDVEFVEGTSSDDKLTEAAAEAGNVYFQEGFSSLKNVAGRFESTHLEAPLVPAFQKVAKGVGFPNMVADIDGKRRRMMPVIGYEGKDHFHQTMVFLMDHLGVKPEQVVHERARYFELKEGFRIPLDEEGCMIISYAGPWAGQSDQEVTFKHYSYVNIIQSYLALQVGEPPSIDLRKLKDKICIIGLTSQASFDVYANPLEKLFPGVGTFSNIINAVINRDFIARLGRWQNTLICLILCLIMAFVSLKNKPLVSLFYAVSMTAFFVTYVINLFIYSGLWVDLFYPVAISTLVYTVGTIVRILGEMRKRELIESELKIASQIQQSFLPAALPQQKGLTVAAFFKPAKAVGGDLYGFVPLGADRIGVMVGDVSGKGTPAALFMGKTVSEFKFSSRDQLDPAKVLANLNDSIASESTGGLFVTLTYAIFDLAQRKMTMANGGHLPVVVARPGGPAELLMAEGGMPIGVMPGVEFSNFECAIKPGECYAFYTDGISEARNRKKEEYDVAALQKALSQYQKQPVQEILDRTVQDVLHFIGKAEQHDDMTLIIVQISS